MCQQSIFAEVINRSNRTWWWISTQWHWSRMKVFTWRPAGELEGKYVTGLINIIELRRGRRCLFQSVFPYLSFKLFFKDILNITQHIWSCCVSATRSAPTLSFCLLTSHLPLKCGCVALCSLTSAVSAQLLPACEQLYKIRSSWKNTSDFILQQCDKHKVLFS